MDPGEQAPVDDIPADFHQDASEGGKGDRLDIATETQHQRQQEYRA